MPTAEELDTTLQHHVARHRDGLLRLATELIAAPSPSPPGDERAAAAVALAELEQLKLGATEVTGPRPERPNILCRWDTGRPGPTLILNGHLDTKPPGSTEDWATDPYQPVVRDGRLYGLGAADMKGPVAALVYGLYAAQTAGAEGLSGSVILALTADEEGQAQDGARYLVQEEGLRGDAVLIAEPCGITREWECLPLVSRGFGAVRFTVRGTPMHSSVSDRLPCVNASLMAARLMLHLQERLVLRHPTGPPYRSGPTFVVGTTVAAGQDPAIVPGRAEFTVNLRTVPGMTREGAAEDIQACLDAFTEEHAEASVDWDFIAGNLAWTTPTETPADEPLVVAVRDAAELVLGAPPPLGTFPGGTDAIWWQGWAGIPTIPAFGPGLLPQCHRPDESVSVDELIHAAMIYALTIHRYLRRSEP